MKITSAMLTAGVWLALLAGCSTSPITPQAAEPVPAERLFAYASGGNASLVVTRDAGLFGAGCNYRFFIDGRMAGEFAAGEVARFSVAAGQHILGAMPSAACGGGGLTERELSIGAGETVRRRISLSSGGADISPTAY